MPVWQIRMSVVSFSFRIHWLRRLSLWPLVLKCRGPFLVVGKVRSLLRKSFRACYSKAIDFIRERIPCSFQAGTLFVLCPPFWGCRWSLLGYMCKEVSPSVSVLLCSFNQEKLFGNSPRVETTRFRFTASICLIKVLLGSVKCTCMV